MSFVAAAIAGSAIVGAGASIYGANKSSSAASRAADLQREAAAEATRIQQEQYNQQRLDNAPWLDAGKNALARINSGLGLNPLVEMYDVPLNGRLSDGTLSDTVRTYQQDPNSHEFDKQFAEAAPEYKSFTSADFTADPGYQFRMSEGQKAMERGAAARGGALSGGALRAMERYRQGVASDEYGNALQRFNTNQNTQYGRYIDRYNRFSNEQNTRLNRLQNLAGIGQSASNQLSTAGQNMAGNVGNNLMAGANATAAGIGGQAAARQAGINGVLGAGNSALNMMMLQNMMGSPSTGNALSTPNAGQVSNRVGVNWGVPG